MKTYVYKDYKACKDYAYKAFKLRRDQNRKFIGSYLVSWNHMFQIDKQN